MYSLSFLISLHAHLTTIHFISYSLDINELLNAEIKPNVVVEICNASERFRNTVECKRTAVRDVDKYIKILNEEALKYTEPRPTCQHLPIIVEGRAAAIPSGDEEERELGIYQDN